MVMLRSWTAAGPSGFEWEDVQGDLLIGVPRLVETFVFLEIVDAQSFKSTLRRSIAHRATSARTARECGLRPRPPGAGPQLLGLNVAFTASGCTKLVAGRVPPDPAFRAGARERAALIGDPEPATNWLPQFYAASIDAVVTIAGSSLKAVEVECKLLLNLLGSSVRVCFRQNAAHRPGTARGEDHFGLPIGSASGAPEPAVPIFGDEGAGADAAPFRWMKNGSYLVFRRIEQLVPEFGEFARDRPSVRGLDAAVRRNSGLAWRGIPFGPEVSDLERREGKTSADRGLVFLSYQTSLEDFESVQRRCVSLHRFAINSASAYAFVPSLSALAGELAR